MSLTPNKHEETETPASPLQLVVALLAGATIFLGLSPYGLWYVALLGVVIFLTLCRPHRKIKQCFYLAMAFYFGMFATGVHWLFVSIHTHGQVPAILAATFTAGFALFMALISSLPWMLLPLVARTTNARVMAFPALWVLSEWARGWVLTGFPWLYLGQAHLHTPLAGWTPVLGVLGTGFMVAITAAALLSIFTQRTPLAVLGQSFVLILIWGGGGILNRMEWTTPLESPLSATLVQPNIDLADKWNPARAQEIIGVLESESEPYWENQLLIWPEAALPQVGREAQDYLDGVSEKAQEENTAFISGYLTYNSETSRYHNAIGGVGLASGEYLKQRLVPFGEYVPLESWIRGLMHFFNLPMSVISAGPSGQSPLEFQRSGQRYVVAPAICYEIAYPSLIAELAQDANLIVTLSNDAWFGDSIGPWQHMEIAQVRALENRKPLLRVTNNGITAGVDYRGKMLAALPQFEAGALNINIQAMSGMTLFSRYGNWPVLILIVSTMLFSAWNSRRPKRVVTEIER